MKQNFNLVLPFYSDASLDGWAMNIRGSFFRAGGEMVATQNIKNKILARESNNKVGGTGNLNPSLNKLPMMVTEIEITTKDIRVGSNPTQSTNFTRVLVQNYSPAKIGLNLANNSEVTFTASIAKSDGNDLHLSTIDRDIKLKGETMDTPNGWGNLVIGSQYKR